MSQELTALLIGGMIGILSSCFGATVSYLLYLRRTEDPTKGPLVILIVVNGTLVLVGFIAVITSLFVGQIVLVILTGIGVFIGVTLTHGFLLFVWNNFMAST